MALATLFPEANANYIAPGYYDLPACSTTHQDHPVKITCWQLTDEERDEVNRTGKVFLMLYMDGGHPPVQLLGSSPFENPASAPESVDHRTSSKTLFSLGLFGQVIMANLAGLEGPDETGKVLTQLYHQMLRQLQTAAQQHGLCQVNAVDAPQVMGFRKPLPAELKQMGLERNAIVPPKRSN